MKTEFLDLVPMTGSSQAHLGGGTCLGFEWSQAVLKCCFTLMLTVQTTL